MKYLHLYYITLNRVNVLIHLDKTLPGLNSDTVGEWVGDGDDIISPLS